MEDWHGFYLCHAGQTRVSGLQISVGASGSISAGKPSVHLVMWMFVYWLEISLEHLGNAESAHAQLIATWSPRDPVEGSKFLREEFSSSLQAICAAAFAVDAFYAAVKNAAPVDKKLIQQWKDKGTARPAQISEVIRRSFLVKQSSVKGLKANLSELYKHRDWAVHPEAAMDDPMLYPELSVSTEWRLVVFRAEHARLLVQCALKLIARNVSRPNPKFRDLVALCESCKAFIAPLEAAWEERRGSLDVYPC